MSDKSQVKYHNALHLLSQTPPASCKAENIDFCKIGLPVYDKHFAILIHNALSAQECKALIEAAEEAETWEPAMVNVGLGEQKMVTDVRLCDRILWDTPEIAAKVLDRVLPFIPDNVKTLQNNAVISGNFAVRAKQTLQVSRLNERLRFLRYTKGCYFRPHCDGSYTTPDGEETSYLTLHLYLNGDVATAKQGREQLENAQLPLQGGATRFFAYTEDDTWDMNPRTGSILIFQHRNLLHSGEDVLQGTKYTLRSDILYRTVEQSK